jgi:D-alanyl-D-alanine carboxypeptidase
MLRPPIIMLTIGLFCLQGTPINAASGAPAASGDDQILVPDHSTAFSAAVDEIVNSEILTDDIPSVAVAVLENGRLLHAGAYGLERVNPETVAKVSTAYLLDSLTKQFTATGIMLLVQEGKLKLDEPIKAYVPYAPKSWDKVTLRHLLNHTSGLPRDPKWGYPSIKEQTNHPDRVLKHSILNQPLIFEPGDKYRYSNAGYVALGAILEKVSGESYVAFLQNHIFQPLDMSSTTIDYRGGALVPGARGYDYDSTKNRWTPHDESYQPLAAGAIQSTVGDLAKWDAALRSTKFLSEASKKQMWTSGTLNDKTPINYGLGWAITRLDNKQNVVWHNGGGWGFDSAFFRFLDAGVTVVVLTNLQFDKDGPDRAVRLAQSIAAAYNPALNMLDASQLSSCTSNGAPQSTTSTSCLPASSAAAPGSNSESGEPQTKPDKLIPE